MTGTSPSRGLRVVIDARLVSGSSGGVEQVAIGLASGLSALEDTDDQYLFLAYEDHDEWLRPFIGGPCQIIRLPAPVSVPPWRMNVSSIPGVRHAWRLIRASLDRWALAPPSSDDVVERMAPDVVHFPMQRAFLTDIPTIYQPHDLQHRHFPQFFDRRQRRWRETHYSIFCRQAGRVVVTSEWAKDDLVHSYGLPDERVQVISWAPPVEVYPTPTSTDLARVRTKFNLPAAFVFYPAQLWPHKNHVMLLEAVAHIREDHGIEIPCVFCGQMSEHASKIQKRVRQLDLDALVRFLGFVAPLELQCLYALARCVVIPTLFEAMSFPLWEAFFAGVPAACSNVTSLPEQAGDAALVFDPRNRDEVATSVLRLWTDEDLRHLLARRGREHVARLSWRETARSFRDLYHDLAGDVRPQTTGLSVSVG